MSSLVHDYSPNGFQYDSYSLVIYWYEEIYWSKRTEHKGCFDSNLQVDDLCALGNSC